MSDSSTKPAIHPGVQLFVLSFCALFLELMLIRWVPAVVRMVAYYANLMLISSFLGLGVGALLARRRWNLFGWFPLLLLILVVLLLAASRVALPTSQQEHRYFASPAQLLNYAILISIFLFNTILFTPLGQRIGRLFHALPPLRAYSWDLGGSLAGTVCFGIFSLLYFSPVLGVLAVMLMYLMVAAEKRVRLAALLLFPLSLGGIFIATEADAVWSPYHYITMMPMVASEHEPPPPREPPANIRTAFNPPLYWARVGRDFYQQHGTLEVHRYPPGRKRDWIERFYYQYTLPYQLAPRHDRIAIMGAGGGMDVQAALMSGVKHVDAVDIDPVLVELSLKYNSSGVYTDPRVSIHIDDARAFMRKMPGGYDMIVFGLLDSQGLFSSMSSLRIDGFVYTEESLRTAWSKLADHGTLCVSFYSPTEWLGPKIVQMIRNATGVQPICYTEEGMLVICAPKPGARPMSVPEQYGGLVRVDVEPFHQAVSTDDWPYLYLARRTVPGDYLIVIVSLIVLSVLAVTLARGGAQIGPGDAHFFFLGFGFLLLQTKSITDCSLYFGTTWLVTMIVIAGVLMMVLAANLVAMRLKHASRWYYLPLLASLLVLYFTPRDFILAQPFVGRLAWALFIVPLPIFFAGLIFSTTFRRASNPSASFGINLIGATLGGFAEYLGMAIGLNALALLVMAAYIASWLCRTFGGRDQVLEMQTVPAAAATG